MSTYCRYPRFWALLWALAFSTVVALGIVRITPDVVRTDLRAMLPTSGDASDSTELLSHTVESSAREVWILVSNPRPESAAQAADIMRETLATTGYILKDPAATFDVSTLNHALLPHRAGFLTESDRSWLEKADDKALLHRALQRLYRPVSTGVGSISDDPLGLFENATAAKEQTARFRLAGKRLVVADPDGSRSWLVMQLVAPSAVSADSSEPITRALHQAQEKVASTVAETEILAAGPPLIGEAAAARADREVSIIGSTSSIVIVILTVLFFSRIAPVIEVLVILSTAIVFAFCSVVATFGEIHLITLVFGTTLLGVGVDYVFHFLCATSSSLSGREAAAQLTRPLTLSLISSVAAYAVIAVCPISGLRQTALFCASGLVCIYACVMTWMAPLTRARNASNIFTRTARLYKKLPRIADSKARILTIALVALFAVAGGMRLTTKNELVLINSIPPDLATAQQRVSALLAPTSPGQFFVLTGNTADDVLTVSERLAHRLDMLRAEGVITNYTLPAKLLTSPDTQHRNALLVTQANERAIKLLERAIGQTLPPPSPYAGILTFEIWHNLVPEALSRMWMSPQKALVTLSGVRPESLPALQKVGREIAGATFTDTTAEIASALSMLRNELATALVTAVVVVSVMLFFGLGRSFPHHLLPTVCALAATAGAAGIAGLPFSLFTVLPLVLVLGLGVDYAVLLYSGTDRQTAPTSVFLAATSTLLAFGLLGLSQTPALKLFGSTLSIALGCVIVFTVLLRPSDR